MQINEKNDTGIMEFSVFWIIVEHGQADPTQIEPDFSRLANKSLGLGKWLILFLQAK